MTGIVYGKTLEIAKIRLQKIIKDYNLFRDIKIEIQEETKRRSIIKLSNGDIWYALAAHKSNTCGRRCNIVYIDSDIEDEDLLIDMRIVACAPPFQGIRYYHN